MGENLRCLAAAPANYVVVSTRPFPRFHFKLCKIQLYDRRFKNVTLGIRCCFINTRMIATFAEIKVKIPYHGIGSMNCSRRKSRLRPPFHFHSDDLHGQERIMSISRVIQAYRSEINNRERTIVFKRHLNKASYIKTGVISVKRERFLA